MQRQREHQGGGEEQVERRGAVSDMQPGLGLIVHLHGKSCKICRADAAKQHYVAFVSLGNSMNDNS